MATPLIHSLSGDGTTTGRPPRRKKSAKERREQRDRATARHVGWLMRTVMSLNHRGSSPAQSWSMVEQLGTADLERGTKELPVRCWFFPHGKCRYGENCRYLHDVDEVVGNVSHGEEIVVPEVPTPASMASTSASRRCRICGDVGHNSRTCTKINAANGNVNTSVPTVIETAVYRQAGDIRDLLTRSGKRLPDGIERMPIISAVGSSTSASASGDGAIGQTATSLLEATMLDDELMDVDIRVQFEYEGNHLEHVYSGDTLVNSVIDDAIGFCAIPEESDIYLEVDGVTMEPSHGTRPIGVIAPSGLTRFLISMVESSAAVAVPSSLSKASELSEK